MSGFTLYILSAFALVFVIEGLFYALFPDAARRMMALALAQPMATLRLTGFFMALCGFTIAWILQKVAGS